MVRSRSLLASGLLFVAACSDPSGPGRAEELSFIMDDVRYLVDNPRGSVSQSSFEINGDSFEINGDSPTISQFRLTVVPYDGPGPYPLGAAGRTQLAVILKSGDQYLDYSTARPGGQGRVSITSIGDCRTSEFPDLVFGGPPDQVTFCTASGTFDGVVADPNDQLKTITEGEFTEVRVQRFARFY